MKPPKESFGVVTGIKVVSVCLVCQKAAIAACILSECAYKGLRMVTDTRGSLDAKHGCLSRGIAMTNTACLRMRLQARMVGREIAGIESGEIMVGYW